MSEHVDVLIVGAGLSGIGAAAHLEQRLPETSYLLLEARDRLGGTWDLFRYPGIRSDSDMYTLGYRFRPWTGDKAIADGPSILAYVQETAHEHGIEEHIRYGVRVERAEWSSADATWTVRATRDGQPVTYTCGFLWSCSGYYRYDEGYRPHFEGEADFVAAGGRLVHPQHWPEDLDTTGQRVVVVGSGATAMTLVPALTQGPTRAAHVTMLQRSPTYVLAMPGVDALAIRLRQRLSPARAYAVTRWKNILVTTASYQLSRRRPALMRRLIRTGVAAALPEGYDVDRHFKPAYDPWDQRLCLVPDGDLFTAIREGDVDVVTDRVERFTPTGLRLASGEELTADVVVTATGLQLLAFGGMGFVVDGEPVHLPDTMAYQGMMLSGVPNFAYVIGYTNASWTLKADLVSDWVCRLLSHLHDGGFDSVVPERDPSVAEEPFMDFASGYVQAVTARAAQAGVAAAVAVAAELLRDVLTLRPRLRRRHASLREDPGPGVGLTEARPPAGELPPPGLAPGERAQVRRHSRRHRGPGSSSAPDELEPRARQRHHVVAGQREWVALSPRARSRWPGNSTASSVPPGATSSHTADMAAPRGGSGSACTVKISTTKSKAPRHGGGSSSRSATR